MANSIENRGQPQRPPIRLVGSVLLLGTLLAWWGTRDNRHLFGEPSRGPVLVSVPDAKLNVQNDTATLARGFQVEQQECAGCHDASTRSIGPSYQAILNFYRHQSALANSKTDLLSALTAAVTHPQPGWANFAAGPPLSSMPLEDRVAVASWILNLAQKKQASEGRGK